MWVWVYVGTRFGLQVSDLGTREGRGLLIRRGIGAFLIPSPFTALLRIIEAVVCECWNSSKRPAEDGENFVLRLRLQRYMSPV